MTCNVLTKVPEPFEGFIAMTLKKAGGITQQGKRGFLVRFGGLPTRNMAFHAQNFACEKLQQTGKKLEGKGPRIGFNNHDTRKGRSTYIWIDTLHIHIYIYIHTCLCTHVHVHLYINICMYVDVYVCKYTHK